VRLDWLKMAQGTNRDSNVTPILTFFEMTLNLPPADDHVEFCGLAEAPKQFQDHRLVYHFKIQ